MQGTHRKAEQIGGGLPLETGALRSAWEKLSARHSSEFTVSPDELSAWHQREAEDSEKAGQWSAAVFHWEQLTRAKPEDQTLSGRLAAARQKLESGPRDR